MYEPREEIFQKEGIAYLGCCWLDKYKGNNKGTIGIFNMKEMDVLSSKGSVGAEDWVEGWESAKNSVKKKKYKNLK